MRLKMANNLERVDLMHMGATYVSGRNTFPAFPHRAQINSVRRNARNSPSASNSTHPICRRFALGLSESELLLRRAGAKHFLIPNLLDVGQLPGAAADRSFATAATVATNNALNLFLGFEELIEGIFIRRVDTFSLFHNIDADATHFGFTNVTTPCLTQGMVVMVCTDPDHTLFWDAEHPTEFGHSLFAVAAEASLAN